MAGCREQGREENEPGPRKQGSAELAAVVDSGSYSRRLYDQHQSSLPHQVAQSAKVNRPWLQQYQAAAAREPPGGIDRAFGDDEPLVGDTLAAGHWRSYSAGK